MSLKAKLEAVIYAAEEPVTLAQLAALFAEDAGAWKAERDAQNMVQKQGVEADPESPVAEEPGEELTGLLPELSLESPSELAVEPLSDDVKEIPTASAVGGSEAGLADEPASVPEGSPDSLAEISPEEAKWLEKKREREIREILRVVLDELIAEYAQDSRGIEIREIAGGFRMGTKPEIHDAVRAFVKSLKPPMKLSLPALETLAVIAYKQPVTAPEVGEVRGVDSAGVLGSLMSRKLIATAGRKQVIGRPMLYKTTKEFLLRFGLKDLTELPSMEEFEKMAAMELSEEPMEEPMDEEQVEPAEQSGDLFAEADTTQGDLSKTDGVVAPADTTSGDLAKTNVMAATEQTQGDLTKTN